MFFSQWARIIYEAEIQADRKLRGPTATKLGQGGYRFRTKSAAELLFSLESAQLLYL